MTSILRAIGSHGNYDWLVTKHSLHQLLQVCPQLVLGKVVAITAFDSGPLTPNKEELALGWTSVAGIAYSPLLKNIKSLPHDCYDEWYVFEKAKNLGSRAESDANVFAEEVVEGLVYPIVNYGGSVLCEGMEALAEKFWSQMAWIQPESYIADGDFLTVASSNRTLFTAARLALEGIAVH